MKRKLPIAIALTLFLIVVLLTIASLTGQYYKAYVGEGEVILKIVDKFDLDLERNNIPTWYQSSTLLVSSLLFGLIAYSKMGAKGVRYWAGLALLFMFLSVDEAISVHEQLILPLRTTFDLEGVFYLSWVIPAVAVLIVFGAVYFRFVMRLPPRTRNLLIAAAILYVSGAVGVEMIGGNYLFVTNDLPTKVTDFRYVLITTAEEFLEMLGIVVLIYALLSELAPVFDLISKAGSVGNGNTGMDRAAAEGSNGGSSLDNRGGSEMTRAMRVKVV